MSGDTEPVIHTVGSFDKHDQTNLGDEILGSVDDVQPKVPDSKLDNTEARKERSSGDSVPRPGARHYSTSPHTSNEPGLVGNIQTVGSAEPACGHAAAAAGREEES